MSQELSFDAETAILTVRSRGTAGGEDSLAQWRSLVRDLPSGPLKILNDRREVEAVAELREVEEGRQMARRFFALIPGSRVAVVVDQAAAFGMARMIEAYTDELPVEFAVFYDVDSAEAWLRGDANA